MKKLFLMTFVLGVMANSGFALEMGGAMKCSDSSGELQYTQWSKGGGAAPGVGMEVGRQTWTYQGKLLDQKINLYQKPSPAMALKEDFFDDSNKQELDMSNANAKPRGSVVYAVKATLERKDGAAVLPGSNQTTVTEYMICTKSYETVPVP